MQFSQEDRFLLLRNPAREPGAKIKLDAADQIDDITLLSYDRKLLRRVVD